MPENETPAAEPAPLDIPRDAAEALYAALGTMLGIPQDDGAAEHATARADQAEESLRRTNIELEHWQTVIVGGLRADLDQARAEGVALQHALVELAGHAGDSPATATCLRGIADRWKYNGVSRLAECAGILLAALPAPAEHPHA